MAQAQDDMQKLPHWLQETQKWEKYQELFQGRREKEAAWKKAEEAFQEAGTLPPKICGSGRRAAQ